MEQSTIEQSKPIISFSSTPTDAPGSVSTEQAMPDHDAALGPGEASLATQELNASSSKSKIDIGAALKQAKDDIKQLRAALEKTRSDMKEIKAASKPERVGPRNLVVCIDGTSNQFGRKVRPLTLYYSKRDTSYHSSKNTNVIELYRLLDKDETQLTFYNSGIGTYATPSWKSWAYRKQQFDHKLDLAIAWYVLLFFSHGIFCVQCHALYRNFERIVQIAYRWLSEQYREGDQIFLFGALNLP